MGCYPPAPPKIERCGLAEPEPRAVPGKFEFRNPKQIQIANARKQTATPDRSFRAFLFFSATAGLGQKGRKEAKKGQV
jgi:hypothetical protein